MNELTKNIDKKFYLVKYMVKDATIDFKYVPSASMAADILTKALVREKKNANQLILGTTCAE